MKDVRAKAARAIAGVSSRGLSFSGSIDELSRPSSLTAKQPANSVDSRSASLDAAFYRELCYGTLRHFFLLDGIARTLLKKPLANKDADIHALLLIGLYQILFLRTPDHAALSATVDAARSLKKKWATGLINGVLRNFLRTQQKPQQSSAGDNAELSNLQSYASHIEKLDHAAQASHPQWLYRAIIEAWPEQSENIIAYNNSPPPMSLRINDNKISRQAYLALLAERDIAAHASELGPHSIVLERAADVTLLPRFAEGWASVQDPGAQLAAQLLNPCAGQRVLDACAAPGGKTTHLLETAENIDLTAIDSQAVRLDQVAENLARCAQSAKLIAADAAETDSWWDGQSFDRILLDAPCSGSGIISHHPDIKLLRRPQDIQSFANQQLRLLNTLWQTLAEKGELLYCTCSIMPAENQLLIQQFLKQTPSAQLLALDANWGVDTGSGHQLLPIPAKNGGFFYARLSKSARL